LCAGIDVLAPIAVGPAIERAPTHRSQIIRNEVGADLVPLVHDRKELTRSRLNGKSGGIAKAGRVRLMRAGLGVDLPHARPIDLHVHPSLGDIAIRPDADVEKAPSTGR
jgi:hypothetical protein